MKSLSSITLSQKTFLGDESFVIGKLKESGVIVLPDFYSNEITKRLDEEFNLFFQSNEKFVRKIDYSNGRAVNFSMREIDNGLFPVTAQTYCDPLMDRITENYFGKKIKSNTTVFVVNDVVGTKHHANDLHFDVHRSLKFFIYLNDTTAENGAFFCVPGSVGIAAKIRKKHGTSINYENRELTRDLPFKDGDVIPIEGKAGTLIIFDTDVFHKAGTVHSGERRVMRGQSDYFPFTEAPPSLFKRIIKKISK